MLVIGKALGFDAVNDAKAQEARGYDGVRVIDHFFSGIPPELPKAVPHAFVSLGAAAAATERVLLTQTMVAATMRHPVEVAQAVACLDRLSGGRAELGLGTGWLAVEHDATGLALGPAADRVGRVVEAARICAAMFDQSGCVDLDGDFFVAHVDAPWPSTPHRPDVMVGVHGPVMLRRLAPIVDRIDLLEANRDGRPRFDGAHHNDADRLAGRIAMARDAAADRALRFSATVNLTVCPDAGARSTVRGAVAAAAGADESDLDGELLRLIDEPDAVLAAFVTLAALGFDRVHIRPSDEFSGAWLDEALPTLRAL